MGRFDLILFDLDGTLADTADDIADALNFAVNELDHPLVPRERIVASIGGGVRKLIERCVDRDHDAVLDAFLRYYAAHCTDRTLLYPGVAATLEKVPVTKVILSNKPTALCRKIVEGLAISRHFTEVHGGDAFPERKPDPALVHRVREAFPGRALIVGDSLTDVQTARAAGIPVCAVTYGYSKPGDLVEADVRIDRFPELLDFL